MIKKLIIGVGLFLFVMVLFSSKSFAYAPNQKWPGQEWTDPDDPDIYLSLEYAVNDSGKIIHTPNNFGGWDLGFAIYQPGNTTGVAGSFDVNFIKQSDKHSDGCNMNGVGTTIDIKWPEGAASNAGLPWPGSGGNGFNCDGATAVPTHFVVSYSSGKYNADTNTTSYGFYFRLNVSAATIADLKAEKDWNKRGYSFYVTTSAGTPGVIRNVPISFIPNGIRGAIMSSSIAIPMGVPCAASGNSQILLYDSDNNDKNAAQMTPGGYVPMYVSANQYDPSSGVQFPNIGWQSGFVDWTDLGGGNYRPNDDPDANSGKGVSDAITYAFTQKASYLIKLHDYGERNYSNIKLPYDGVTECASANINADAGGGGGAGVGSTFTFTGWVDVTNAVRTAGKTFGWSNVSTGPNPAGPATGGNAPIADGRQVADVQPVYLPTRGTYERTITVTSVPDLGSGQPVVTGSPSKQTITVVGWDTHVDSSMSGPANAGISADGKKMTILKGQSVTFNHHAYTTGDPLHTNIDVNILRHGSGNDFGPTNVSGNPCEDVPPGGTTCNTYRYDSANLSPGASDKTGSRTYTFSNTGKYCEYAWYSMAADNAGASDNSAGMICVYIVDPRPVATHIEYEKNPSGMDPGINMLVSFPAGSYCPEAGGPSTTFHYGYNINFAAKIPGLADKAAGNIPVTYAAGSCADASIEVKINYTEATKLNDINVLPGTTINYSISLLENGLTDTNTITVVEIPFSRFYGNDIYSKNGPIVFNTKSFGPGGDDTSFGAGSGSQYAAIANSLLGPATGDDRTRMPLDTALFRVDTAPFRTGGLKASVAGERQPKPGSIFDNLPSSATGGSVNWAADGFYDYGSSNDATNLTPSNVSVSKKVTVRAKDILITNNITTASFTSLETAPVVLLVAEGDIYIDKSVTQIDAILLAPNGTIHTCSSAATKTLVNAVDWEKTPANGGCRNKLVINGAVGAGNIVYNRTLGSRMMSSDAEGSGADANTGMAVPAPPLLFGLTGTPAYTTDIYGYVVDKSMLNYGSYYDYYRLGVVSPALTNDVNNRIKTAKNITPISTSIAVKPVGKSGSLQVDVKYSYLPSQGTNPGKPGTPIPKPPVITPPVIITPPIVAPDPMKTSAEVVKFPAYLYYATPFLKDTGENGWESIFSGPPLL